MLLTTPNEYLHAKDMQLPEEYFLALPEGCVKSTYFPYQSAHNAIWDLKHGGNDRYFVSLCGELVHPLCTELYEYFPDGQRLERCFRLDDEIFRNRDAITPSKIHTCISPGPDGNIIMGTHTTARSPLHPYWMFDCYYDHLFEGYEGSNIILWHPEKKEFRNLGIPVPRDSIYGGCYDARNNAYYFTTFLRGHLIRLDLNDMSTFDYGQVTEFGSYGVVQDRLGNIYTSSRSGHLFHINVDTRKLTDLGQMAKQREDNPLWQMHQVIAHHTQAPDGRLWLALHFSDNFYAVDPETLQVETIPMPASPGWRNTPPQTHKGMTFDKNGTLWWMTMRAVNSAGSLIHLHRTDPRTGEDFCFGLVGEEKRICNTASESFLRNNIWHVADTNHGPDMPRILALDLDKLEHADLSSRRQTTDISAYISEPGYAQFYPGDYAKDSKQSDIASVGYDVEKDFLANQACTFFPFEGMKGYRLWKQMPDDESSPAVKSLEWKDDSTLIVRAGDNGRFLFEIKEWQLTLKDSNAPQTPEKAETEIPADMPELPWRQGRRHNNKVAAVAKLADGKYFAASNDAVFALYTPGSQKIFALGEIGNSGPVHALAVTPDGKEVYGVCGYHSSLGHIFHFDCESGLRDMGRTFATPPLEIVYSSTEPNTVAISPDGKYLAIGVADRLTCVYVYPLDEVKKAALMK